MRSDPRFKANVHLIFTIVVLVFIFIQSSFSAEVSSLETSIFAAFLRGLFGESALLRTHFLRKAGHFTEFAALGICLLTNVFDWITLHPDRQVGVLPASVAAWLGGTLYAATDELHQLFVPGRSASFQDVCIDSAGVLSGILLCVLIRAAVRAIRRKRDASDSE